MDQKQVAAEHLRLLAAAAAAAAGIMMAEMSWSANLAGIPQIPKRRNNWALMIL
jgi:hypothetical protein